jgi:hypothetical protein
MHNLAHWRNASFASCIALALAGTTASIAQTTPESNSGRRVFEPDFFAAYVPVSALDMVDRVPGFSINNGDDRRGFGDTAGNVLIDGERPSTKADSVRTILSRIPASQVERIELIEEAGSSTDARGQAQLINVVRKAGSAVSGTYEADVEIGESGVVTPYGSASATLRRGLTTYDVSGSLYTQFNRQVGVETVRNGRQQITELRDQISRDRYNEANISAALKTAAGSTKINVNGKLNVQWFGNRRDTLFFSPIRTPLGMEELRIKDPKRRTAIELGGDIDFPLGTAVKTKLIGLYNNTRAQDGQTVLTRRGAFEELGTTNGRRVPTEIILRNQTDWTVSADHAVQFGVEVALNQLVASFNASSTRNGAVTQFPASDVTVKEWRAEPFISDIWTLSPAWKLEAGIVAEKSRLTVGGGARRNFLFWKPRAVASWTVDDKTSAEFRVERQVAQLDFGDFVTSVDLGNNQVNAGNSKLVPEKTLKFETVLRHKFWDRGSVQLGLSYISVTDTQDLIPVTERDANGVILSQFDGPGNIGPSKRWNVEAEVTLPFDRVTEPLGITGMQLKWVGHYHGARVTDPVTGLSRGRSSEPLFHHDFNFRHDLAKAGISWGVDVSLRRPDIAYFIDQISTFSAGPETFLWVEYKKFSLGTLRFQIGNPTDVRLRRDRVFFRDTRATGDVITSFARERRRDRRFLFSLNGKF